MNRKTTALLGAAMFLAWTTADAQLTWEKTTIELNPKAGDQETVANFKYENKTAKPIKIKSVKSSCGCTVPALKKDVVEPGEKGELTATFKIGGRTGKQQKTVTVETDDPAQPVMNLLLVADIAQPLQIQPTFVYWEQGSQATPKVVKVKAAKDVNLGKIEVMSSSPEFTASVEKGSAPGEFNISIQPKSTGQLLNAMLTIKSELPQPSYITARVTGPAAASAKP